MRRTRRPVELWQKRMRFPRGQSLLDRGFHHTHSLNEPHFRNCEPQEIHDYIDKNVNRDSHVTRRHAELIKWSLFKAGTNIYDMPYTIYPLKIHRNGGRAPCGTQWIKHKGGGCNRAYFMTDKWRMHPEDKDIVKETVVEIINDQIRSALIAHVSGGLRRRFIVATEGMQVGDVLISTRLIPDYSVTINPGDCYPLGAFPVGSKICCVERSPGGGQQLAMAAGSSVTVRSKTWCPETLTNLVCIQLPSKINQLLLDERCLAVFGQCSFAQFNQIKFGYFGQKKLETDRRSRSGFKCLKTGRFGRKVRREREPVKAAKITPHSTVDIRTFH